MAKKKPRDGEKEATDYVGDGEGPRQKEVRVRIPPERKGKIRTAQAVYQTHVSWVLAGTGGSMPSSAKGRAAS